MCSDIPPNLLFENIFSNATRDLFIENADKKLYMHPFRSKQEPTSHAAVLVCLGMFDGVPSFLFTLRSGLLRSHSWQVSFPGGLCESSDNHFQQTAFREAHEEVRLNISELDVWTTLRPFKSNARSTQVIHPVFATHKSECSIKSLSVDPMEVFEVFQIPLWSLVQPSHIGFTNFRSNFFAKDNTRPTVRRYSLPCFTGGKYRVWGITAVLLHHVLQCLAPNVYSGQHVQNIPSIESS